jgi:hypothetical protein
VVKRLGSLNSLVIKIHQGVDFLVYLEHIRTGLQKEISAEKKARE